MGRRGGATRPLLREGDLYSIRIHLLGTSGFYRSKPRGWASGNFVLFIDVRRRTALLEARTMAAADDLDDVDALLEEPFRNDSSFKVKVLTISGNSNEIFVVQGCVYFCQAHLIHCRAKSRRTSVIDGEILRLNSFIVGGCRHVFCSKIYGQ